MQSKGKNWSLTVNNPSKNLDEFFDYVVATKPLYARAQLECGEGGTPHFQACIGWSSEKRFAAV